jgi:hypothetical protein
VAGALLDDPLEVGQRPGVVAELVERLAHEELGELLFGGLVVGLALEDLGQLDRRLVVLVVLVELDRPLQRFGGLLGVRRRRAPALGIGRLDRLVFDEALVVVVLRERLGGDGRDG